MCVGRFDEPVDNREQQMKDSFAAVAKLQQALDEIEEPETEEHHAKPETEARKFQVGGDHYTRMQVQPWDVIEDWPPAQQFGVFRHGVLKYVMRAGVKNDDPMEDLQKARHYLDKLIDLTEEAL